MWRWTPIQVELCGVYTLSQVNILYGLKKGNNYLVQRYSVNG